MTRPDWHTTLLQEPIPPWSSGFYAAGGGAGGEPFAAIEPCTDPDHPHGVLLAQLARRIEALDLQGPVLEVGLHRSGWLAWLQRRGLRALGLDASEPWVRHQAQLAAARGHQALLLHGDVTALPLVDACIGSVLALDVLEHVSDPDRALAELARVLRPGGLLVMHVPVADRSGTWEAAWQARDPRGYAAVQARVGHVKERIVPAPVWMERLARAGLRVDRHERLQRWVGPLHDYRWLPVLGRLRRGAGGSAATAGAPPSGRRRYADRVLPPVHAVTALEGRLWPDRGSSVFVVATCH